MYLTVSSITTNQSQLCEQRCKSNGHSVLSAYFPSKQEKNMYIFGSFLKACLLSFHVPSFYLQQDAWG